jgi:hypothetical protein
MPTIASSNPPDFQQYVAAFQAIDNLKDDYLQILQIHYHTHETTITAKQLAQAMGYSHHTTANMMYGRCTSSVSNLRDGEEYEVDPVKDLRPVCPNCHAMIHRRSPPLSIEEIIRLRKSLE